MPPYGKQRRPPQKYHPNRMRKYGLVQRQGASQCDHIQITTDLLHGGRRLNGPVTARIKFDNYGEDEDNEAGPVPFTNVKGLTYHPNNEDDPHITLEGVWDAEANQNVRETLGTKVSEVGKTWKEQAGGGIAGVADDGEGNGDDNK